MAEEKNDAQAGTLEGVAMAEEENDAQAGISEGAEVQAEQPSDEQIVQALIGTVAQV